jgi:hypothetical protein
MAYDTFSRSFKHGSLVLTDGTASPGPYSVTVILDQGDLSWTESHQVIQHIQRGSIASDGSHPIAGLDEACTWSFTGIVSKFAGATTVSTPYSITNNYDATHTSVGTAGEAYQFKMVYTLAHPDGTSGNSQTITFNYCMLEGTVDISEGEPSTMTFSGLDWELRPVFT